jgi:hypothetical protein
MSDQVTISKSAIYLVVAAVAIGVSLMGYQCYSQCMQYRDPVTQQVGAPPPIDTRKKFILFNIWAILMFGAYTWLSDTQAFKTNKWFVIAAVGLILGVLVVWSVPQFYERYSPKVEV